MIAKSGVKVLDFGLARSGTDETLTASHMVIGTPAYMAPEQREGKPADARTDIYSFGCVLYEMLTGERVGPQRKRIAPRKAGNNRKPVSGRGPGTKMAICRRVAAGTGGGYRAEARDACGRERHRIAALCVQQPTFISTARRNSLRKTRSFWANSRTRPASRCLTGPFARAWPCNSEQSPFLTLVSDQTSQQALRLMNRPPETPLTSEVAREICQRTGGAAVLEGSIASVGNQYVLWLRARNCRSGDVLAQEQAVAGKKEEVLSALTRIAAQIRTRLGESLATIQEHSTPLEQATTSSLEALKAYSAGRIAIFARGGRPRSRICSRPSPSIRNSRWRMPIWASCSGTWAKPIWCRANAHSLWPSRSRERSGEALHH